MTSPSLVEDSVDLQQGCEEVLATALEIISYWCDNQDLLSTIGDLPQHVYAASLETRMHVATQVLRYSDTMGERVWRELEARDENEDQWTFEEEQDTVGRIGRVTAGPTCEFLLRVFEGLINSMENCRNEGESDLLQEQVYWVLVYVKHFISDFDCEEIPIAFTAITSDPQYPLLLFMDVWVQIKRLVHYRIMILSVFSLYLHLPSHQYFFKQSLPICEVLPHYISLFVLN